MRQKVLGVIPARYASTRFPGKALHLIAGRPLLEWVVQGCRKSQSLTDLVVATDHPQIAALAEDLGVRAIMTAPELPSGSDRVWAVAQQEHCEAVVNIQGDEPLVTGELVDSLVQGFWESGAAMGTLIKPMERKYLKDPNVVKAVINQKGDALYFSRFPVPYSRNQPLENSDSIAGCWQHLGLYIYRKDFLQRFCETAPVDLEQFEGLEQLRALWLGARIRTTVVDYFCLGVDTPEDVQKVEPYLVAGRG